MVPKFPKGLQNLVHVQVKVGFVHVFGRLRWDKGFAVYNFKNRCDIIAYFRPGENVSAVFILRAVETLACTVETHNNITTILKLYQNLPVAYSKPR